jgi:hypothetical protein
MNQTTMPFESMARTKDANFHNFGLFGELTQLLGERDRIIAGLRADRWYAKDARSTTVSADQSRDDTLPSGFARTSMISPTHGRPPMRALATRSVFPTTGN